MYMKRPLVLVGFCYLLTLAAAVYFGVNMSMILACAALLGFIVAMFVPKLRVTGIFPAAFLAMSVAFGSFYGFNKTVMEPVQALAGKDAVIEGTVCELPAKAYGRFYYVAEVNSISGKKVEHPFKIRISTRNALHVEPYSHVQGKVHLFLPNGGEGYSSRSYYASKGIPLFAFLYEYEGVKVSPPTQKPPYYYALRLRSALLKSVRSILPPEEAGLINGVLFGDKAGLPRQVTEDFRTIGISHILSVSGLHMATMAQLILMLLLFLKIPKRAASFIACAGVICFMAVTCFVPSVTRSGIMCLLYLAGMVVSRRPDSLNSLGIAVLLISLGNPYAAADVGLLLSFAATLGLILYSGKTAAFLNAKLDRIPKISPLVRGANGILATTVCAVLFTLPIIIVAFGRVSLAAPAANLLELVPSTLMMNFSAIAAVINLLSPKSFLAMPFALAAGLLAKFMLFCAHWLAQIPFASVSASGGFVLLWLAGTILLLASAMLMKQSRRLYRHVALLSAILLFTGILSHQVFLRDVTRLAVLDVGSAESVVLTRNGRAAVFGCGGFSSDPIKSYLQSEGVTRLDCIQPLTLSDEESKNAAELIRAFSPRKVLIQNDGLINGFLQKELPNAAEVSTFHLTARVHLWDNTEVNAQWNGKACTAHISAGGVSVLICPEEVNLSELPPQWLDADVLVTNSMLPQMELLNPVCCVLSMDQEDLYMAGTNLRGKNPVITGGAGNIVFEIRENRTVKLRRE
jgi:competence protein ComEC